jgi:glycosyltransferase involved in cell wall biosynthesis
MRIVHITDVYRPQVGGIEIFVDDLAHRQAAAGHDVTVLTPTPALLGETTSGPVTVVRAGSSSKVLAGRDALRLGRYDVAHVHLSVVSPFSTLVAQAGVAAGTPTVNTVHSMWKGREAWVRAVGMLAGWNRWPVVWTSVSSAAAADVCRVLPSDHRVVVVPNAVDVAWWREVDRSAELATGGPVTLMTVMRLVGRKRPLPFVRILREVRGKVPAEIPIRAVIVGDGPLEARTRDALRRRGMDRWVSLPGRLSRGQIRDLYRTADAYVAPAELESFGIAALEARAAGLPVVAMGSGGVADFITDGVEGFLCGDDNEMARTVAELVLDVERRSAMAAHNAAVAPNLDWEAVVDRFDVAYGLAMQAQDWNRRVFGLRTARLID